MIYSRIAGTGSYLPEKILTNHDLEKMVDTTDEWIVERTGIHQRHIASDNETASSLATEAADSALQAAKIPADTLDFIIVATCTPDRVIPSTACLVQKNLGISGCAAFDVNAACAGFNYALGIANNFIRQGEGKRALVIGSEVMSRIMDWTDRSTCVLFGDGAGAVILESSEEPGILSTHLHAAGEYEEALYTPNPIASAVTDHEPAYMKMQGQEVFRLAVTKLKEIVDETLSANQLKGSTVDWLIPHQANLRIIQATAKRLALTMDQVVLTLDKQGNTSAASVPLALDHAVRNNQVKRDDILLLESFGAGFTWGSALIRY